MKKILFLAVFAVVSNFATAQHTKQNLDNFTVIDAFGPFEIELIKSDSESIDIDYRQVKPEDLIVEVRDKVLRLKIKNRHFINEWRYNDGERYHDNDYVRVKLYFKDIDAIEIEAGIKLTCKGILKSKNLDLTANMGAEVDLDLLAQNVGIQSNMGAMIRLSGKTENLEIRTSMGSEIKTTRLEAKVAYIKATMGSEVDVYVSDQIEATAGWGAMINYTGGPTVRHSNTSMGGEIYHTRRH